MSDLTEFLLARIAEDCADAMSGWRWKGLPAGEYERLQARVLAECEAKRRIVDEHPATEPFNHEGDRYCRRCLHREADSGYPDEWVQAYYPCPTLRALAAVYADHPDYREEWKP